MESDAAPGSVAGSDLLDRLQALLRDPSTAPGGAADALRELRQLVLAGGGLPPDVAAAPLAPGCTVRAAVWRLLVGALPAAGNADAYFALVARGPSRCADKIAQDVGRTLRGDPALPALAPADARTRLLNAFVHHCDDGAAEAAAAASRPAQGARPDIAARADVDAVAGVVDPDAAALAPPSTVLGTRAGTGDGDAAATSAGHKRERYAGAPAGLPLPQLHAVARTADADAELQSGDGNAPPTPPSQQQPHPPSRMHKRSRSSGDATAGGGFLPADVGGTGTGGSYGASVALTASPAQPEAGRVTHQPTRSSAVGHRRSMSGASSGTALSAAGSSLGGDFAVSTLTTTSSVGTVAGGSRGDEESGAEELAAGGELLAEAPPLPVAGTSSVDATPSSSVPSHYSTPASRAGASTATATTTCTSIVDVGDGSLSAASRGTDAPTPPQPHHRHAHPPSVCGYSQGMGSLAAVLLSVLPEPDAFTALVALVTRGVPGLYDVRQRGVREGCALADALLRHADPVVHGHLLGVYGPFSSHAELMFFSRLASLFAHRPPLGTIARLWDVILAGGAHVVPLLCAAEAVLRRDELLAAGRNAITRFQGIGRGGGGGGGGGGDGGGEAGDALPPQPPAPGGWLPPPDDLLATAFGLLHELPAHLTERLHAFARRVSPWPPLPAPAAAAPAQDAAAAPSRGSREAEGAAVAAVAAPAPLSPATESDAREQTSRVHTHRNAAQHERTTAAAHSLSAMQLPSPPQLLLPIPPPATAAGGADDTELSPPAEPFPSPPPVPHAAEAASSPQPPRVDKPRARRPASADGGGVSTTSPLAAALGGSSGGATRRGATADLRPRPLLTRAAPGARSDQVSSPAAITPASAPACFGGGGGGVHDARTPRSSDRAGYEVTAHGTQLHGWAGAGHDDADEAESVASAVATPPPPASLRARVSGAIAEHVARMRRSSAGRQRSAEAGDSGSSPFTSPRPPAAAVFAGPPTYRRRSIGVGSTGESTAASTSAAAPGHRRHHTVQAGALQEAAAPLRVSRTAAGSHFSDGGTGGVRSRSAAATGGSKGGGNA